MLRSPSVRSLAAALALALFAAVPARAADDTKGLESGQVDVRMVDVPGSGTPKVVVRAIVESPPAKVWAVVSDCAHYRERMPRIARSRQVKREGNKVTCEVTVEMPFPLANLTATTEAVHEEGPAGMSRRWKLVHGDYDVNEGAWIVKPIRDGAASLVTYEVHAEPKTPVPAFLREAAQKKALPDLMRRLRVEAAKM